MRYILPILTLAFCSLAIPSLASGQEQPVDGNRLVAAACEALANAPPLSARFTTRATVFGKFVDGHGEFHQRTERGQVLSRYNLTLIAHPDLTVLEQFNDGSALWILRKVGARQSAAYVNLRRVRERMPQATKSPTSTNVDLDALAIGGLGQLLTGLSRRFEFQTATASVANGSPGGDLPTWTVVGSWRPAALVELLPNQREQILAGRPANTTELPAHLPNAVKLVLHRGGAFPLFPFHIEFGRRQPADNHPAANPSEPAQIVKPLVSWKFLSVQLDRSLSVNSFTPVVDNSVTEDQTELYISRFGTAAK